MKTCIVVCLLILCACDSPRNRRIISDNNVDLSKASPMDFKSFQLMVQVQWLNKPSGNIQQKNQLLVVMKDSSGQPRSLPSGYSLSFYATMPSMGHPMEEAGYFEELAEGVYLNNSIRFNMSGDWRNELWIMDQQFNILDKVTWDIFF